MTEPDSDDPTKARTMHRRCTAAFVILLTAGLGLAACERSSADEGTSSHAHSDEHHEGESHGHAGESHFHLAPKMVVLSRRFSAIWFAGLNGNHDMLHYQAHELDELLAEIEQASPKENGIDVASRLESDVISELEGLEKAVKDGETETFRDSYKKIVQNCSSCHADTGYDQLNVTVPTRNPYPNLDLGSESPKPAEESKSQ